ncbi:MAG: dihydropteroate synthase [Chloroflexi bacterium]|nr:dihydropteroate synthase [Chloroflexota bacterium]
MGEPLTLQSQIQNPKSKIPLARRTLIMGVINMTPDSFSGDGLNGDAEAALRQGEAMVRAGADLLDVGGESTRPGHAPIDEATELARALPAVERLARALPVPVSIDTRHSNVARAALDAGASLINDVSALQDDPALAALAAERGCPLILSHWTRGPRVAGQSIVERVIADLQVATQQALAAGVAPEQIVVDPGIGFGKVAEESLELLRRLGELRRALPYPLLVGPSRKSFIGKVLGLPPEERLEGTAAAVAAAILGGADIVRVHDVLPMVRVARVADAIARGWEPPV